MKDRNVQILSTRPLDEMLVKKAMLSEVTIDTVSFIETKNIIDSHTAAQIEELAATPATVVFTSMNGAEAVIDTLQKAEIQPHWNIYCIGAATKNIISRYFLLANISGIGKNAFELSGSIIKSEVREVVFFCGNQRRDELPDQLRKNNVNVKEIVVYETNEIPIKIQKLYNGILFFSPSAVKSFFSANTIADDTVLFSIGDTTGEAIRNNCNNKIITSDFPAKDKLAEIAIAYFDKTLKPND